KDLVGGGSGDDEVDDRNRVGEGLADKQLAYNPLHREGAGNVWVHNYPKPRLDTRRKIVAPAIVTRVSPRLADNRARPASGRLHRSSRHRQGRKGDVVVVDVRDAPELATGGKIKGAVHVPRGMLEFRADPESPYHNPALRKEKTTVLYCASGGRS